MPPLTTLGQRVAAAIKRTSPRAYQRLTGQTSKTFSGTDTMPTRAEMLATLQAAGWNLDDIALWPDEQLKKACDEAARTGDVPGQKSFSDRPSAGALSARGQRVHAAARRAKS